MRNRNKKIIYFGLVFLFLISIFLVTTVPAFAQIPLPSGSPTNKDIFEIANTAINYVMGLFGFIAVIVMLYGGFVWMTAAGNSDQVDKAKDIIRNGLIGLVIILAAWAIVRFVFNMVTGTGGTCDPCSTMGVSRSCTPSCSGGSGFANQVCDGSCWGTCVSTCSRNIMPTPAYSNFVVTSKYPKADSTGVSRCSLIQVNFNKKIVNDQANKDRITIYECTDSTCSSSIEFTDGQELIGNTVPPSDPSYDPALEKIYTFYPTADYGNETWYRVVISNDFKNSAGETLGTQVDWKFQAGSLLDDTAPEVAREYPTGTDVCINSVIQAEFNEPMDRRTLNTANFNLSSTSGYVPNFLSYTPSNLLVTYQPQDPYDSFTAYRSKIFGSGDDRVAWDRTDPNQGARDICGNPLAPPSHAWDFTTSDNADCRPEIISITTDAYHDGLITIEGHYFTLGGNVVFNHNVYDSADTCFDNGSDGYYNPNEPCMTSWNLPPSHPNQITLKLPAGDGNSNGPVNGPLEIKITDSTSTYDGRSFAGLSAISNDTLEIKSPHIDVISGYNGTTSVNAVGGARGGAGQIISIMGRNFGTTRGIVKFIRISDGKVEKEATLPPGCAGTAWTENQVAAVVPDGFNLDEKLKIQLMIDSGHLTEQNRSSNLMDFEFTDEVGPGICGSSFSCGGTSGVCGGISGDKYFDTLSVPGEIHGMAFGISSPGELRFGDQITPGTIGGTVDPNDTNTFGYTHWIDDVINTYVPFGIAYGLNPIKVFHGGVSSNAWNFQSPCDVTFCDGNSTTPRCDQTDSMCRSDQVCSLACVCEPAFRVVSRRPACTTACVNTAIEVVFSQEVDDTTLSGNIFLNSSSSGFRIDSVSYDSTLDQTTVLIYTNSLLTSDTKYEVVLTDGIKNVAGDSLSKLNHDHGPVGRNNSYMWEFTTRTSGEICDADSVAIMGSSSIATNNSNNYTATLSNSSNCGGSLINPYLSDYGFGWIEYGGSLLPDIIPADTQNTVVTAGAATGSTNLKIDITGDATLDATKPIEVTAGGGPGPGSTFSVTNNYPDNTCTEACLNTAIKVVFSYHIDTASFDFGTQVKLTDSSGSPVAIDMLNPPSDILMFYPSGDLTRDTTYTVTLDSSIQNASGVSLGSDHSWTFKTKDTADLCEPDLIEIYSPGVNPVEIVKARTKTLYTSTGSSGNCAGTPIDSRGLGLSYDWIDNKHPDDLSLVLNPVDGYTNCEVTAGSGLGNTQVNVDLSNSGGFLAYADKNIEVVEGGVVGSPCYDVTTSPSCLPNPGCSLGLICDSCVCIPDSSPLPLPPGLEITAVNTPEFCTNGLVEVDFDRDISSFCRGVGFLHSGFDKFRCGGNKLFLEKGGIGLESNTPYTVDITDSSGSSVFSPLGLNPISFNMAASATKCSLDSVKIDPEEFEFNERGQTGEFLAVPYSRSGESIGLDRRAGLTSWNLVSAVGSLDFDGAYVLDDLITPVIIKTLDDPENITTLLQVSVIDTAEDGSDIVAVGNAEVSVSLCEKRGLFEYKSHAGYLSFADYTAPETNFSLSYCRDSNPDFPEMIEVTEGAILPGTDTSEPSSFIPGKHYILRDASGTDPLDGVIGLLVFQNLSYQELNRWFADKFGRYFSGNSLTVDGYPAIQDGRSIYVGAVNIDNTTSTKYTNVYLLSYDKNADPAIVGLYQELINSWTFNTNVMTDPDFDKEILARDMNRVFDLAYVKSLLERYKDEKGHYPVLSMDASHSASSSGDGVVSVGETTSLWNSWSTVLGRELATTSSNVAMPIDPLNKLGIINVDYSGFPSECSGIINTENYCECVLNSDCGIISTYSPQCYIGLCIRLEPGYSPETGWNEFERNYACPDESHFYIYKYVDDDNYLLTTNMENDVSGWDGFDEITFPSIGAEPCINW